MPLLQLMLFALLPYLLLELLLLLLLMFLVSVSLAQYKFSSKVLPSGIFFTSVFLALNRIFQPRKKSHQQSLDYRLLLFTKDSKKCNRTLKRRFSCEEINLKMFPHFLSRWRQLHCVSLTTTIFWHFCKKESFGNNWMEVADYSSGLRWWVILLSWSFLRWF